MSTPREQFEAEAADPARSIADRAIAAQCAAMMASDSENEACGSCPFCGELLMIAKKHADHMPPMCAEWAEYAENWTPPEES